jgi:preprotein translocase subunit SecA
MLKALRKIFGDSNSRKIKPLWDIVGKINAYESDIQKLSNDEVRARTETLKKYLAEGRSLEDILPEAFALVREASRRVSGERHFDVQMIGGIILHRGNISEMRTGEGKTLVATLPAYLNALTGKGVHIVTVNDYLSRRDAVWMGQIYAFLGLTVGVINHESSFLYDAAHIQKDEERDETGSFRVVHEFLRPCSRHDAYMADITYGTNSEFGFDYLRDNISYELRQIRQRDFNFAIVDEIDSILIDEARTPLIISAPTTDSEDLYTTFAGIALQMIRDVDFTVDEKMKAIQLTDAGINKAEKILGVGSIYTEKGIKYVHHLETAIRAKALFTLDKEYVVREGEIIIVDEFTGRLQPGRRWSEGLHQAVEAKEGVPIQKESRTMASITYQNYFRMYKKLCGMTGTAMTSAEEFYKVYGLDVIAVPTNRPIARKDHNDLIYQTESGKFKAISKKIKELNRTGQPVLIGTASIEKNELLSEYLKREGVSHQMLNAKNHEKEGEIIAQAGRKGAVTIATNMAGRGVDIKLGGNPTSPELSEGVRALGGLVVLGTERHEARRIDNQLRGRSGRQGDPGETIFYVSLEDSLMRVFASDTIKTMMGKFGIPEDEPIENYLITKSLETAQTKIEGFHFDSRKNILEYDDVLNHQRKIIYERRRAVLMGGIVDIEQYITGIIGENAEVTARLSEKRQAMGDTPYENVARQVILQSIDMFWVEHLEVMDYMRSSVNLRAYGQRDPLVEYRKEGLRMFKQLEMSVAEQVVSILMNINTEALAKESREMQTIKEQATTISNTGLDTVKPMPAGHEGEVGRNDLCPCGSGKKFKKCHGQ